MAELNLKLDLRGIGFLKPGGQLDVLSGGPHQIEITEVSEESAKNGQGTNAVFSIKVSEGADAGKTAKVFISTNPEGTKNPEVVKKHWKNLLVNIAKDPAVLEKGEIALKSASFVGKKAYIYVQPVEGKDDQGRDRLPNINFIPPEMVKELKATPTALKKNGAFKPVVAGAGAAQAAQSAATAPAPAETELL